jgi:nucleotide-binding universal stress UspA family protein
MTEGLQRSSDPPNRDQSTPPVVVVGVDGGPASRCAALAAAGAARSMGGQVLAVHVPTPSPWHSLAGCLGAGSAVTGLTAAATERVRSELAALFALADVRWEFEVAHDAVHTSLLRAAERCDAALIVVGATGRRRLGVLRRLRRGTDRLLVVEGGRTPAG